MNARFVTQALTGVQRYAFEISRQLLILYPNTVLLQPKQHKQPWALDLPTTTLGKHQGHLWEQWDLARFMRKNPKAILLNLGNTAPLFLNNQCCCLHDLAFRHVPENFSWRFRSWYTWMVPRYLKHARAILTVSETMKEEIETAFPITKNKIHVVPNGIPSFPHRILPKEKWILSVGSISQRKQMDVVLQAFIQSDKLRDYTFIQVGAAQSIFPSSTLPTHPRVLYYNHLSDEALQEVYARSEIVVNASLYEGFGLPVLEALFYQCKVLCSNIPVFHELFEDYVYFCEVNPSAIKTSLEDMPANPVRDTKTLAKRFSYHQSATKLLNILLSCGLQ